MRLQSNFGVQRALLKNGQIIRSCLMVGVKPLENMHRAAAESINRGLQAPVRPVTIMPYKLNSIASKARLL